MTESGKRLPESAVWDKDQAAHYLRGINTRTLMNWVKAGKIACIRTGRLVGFRKADLDAFLDACTTNAATPA